MEKGCEMEKRHGARQRQDLAKMALQRVLKIVVRFLVVQARERRYNQLEVVNAETVCLRLKREQKALR